MATGELGEPDLLDPNPDIHELFAHYNSLYFRNALGPCLVSWSSPRMTSPISASILGPSPDQGSLPDPAPTKVQEVWKSMRCCAPLCKRTEEAMRAAPLFLQLQNPQLRPLVSFLPSTPYSLMVGRWISSVGRVSSSTSCAGTCKYLPGGSCEIRLSEPLLKFRSAADLKNTLLHEMIHAFLWMEDKNKNHSEHGSKFQSIMKVINSCSVADHQRPSGGYNITIYHEFHEEVDSYRVHHWLCESCGDLIERTMNREPSTSDCIDNMGHAKSCGNSSCHWHRHKMTCSGTYMKIAEPPGFEDRRMVVKGVHELHGDTSKGASRITRQTAKRSHTEETDNTSDVKKMKMITGFFPVAHNTNKNSGNGSSAGDSKKEVECKALMIIEPMTRDPVVVTEAPKRPRTPLCRKKRNYVCTKSNKSRKHKDQCPVMSVWLDYYADEETDGDIEPLINKRSERRKKQKLLQDLKGKEAEFEAMGGTSPSCESSDSNSGGGNTIYPFLCYGGGGRWKSTKSLTNPCEGASPRNSPVRDNVIDLSDG